MVIVSISLILTASNFYYISNKTFGWIGLEQKTHIGISSTHALSIMPLTSQPFYLAYFRYVLKERSESLTNAQRSQIVWNILTRAGYDNARKEKVNDQLHCKISHRLHWKNFNHIELQNFNHIELQTSF